MAKTDLTPSQTLNLTKAKFFTVTAYSIVFKAIGSKMQAANCRVRRWPSKINFCKHISPMLHEKSNLEEIYNAIPLPSSQPCYLSRRIFEALSKTKIKIFCSGAKPMQPYDLDVEFFSKYVVLQFFKINILKLNYKRL